MPFRYDDTNPEAEKQEYIDHIEEIVRWMGWEPYKVFLLSFIFVYGACIKQEPSPSIIFNSPLSTTTL